MSRASSAIATRSWTDTLVVAITQSGETADTLAGVREARANGAKAFAITNVVGSRVTRESDGVIYTHAGPEIGVAATKTFTAQIAALMVLALKLAQVKGTLEQSRIEEHLGGDLAVCRRSSRRSSAATTTSRRARGSTWTRSSSLFLGRGIGVPVAMEGALKLKEISYIHAEAYAGRRDEARADRAHHRGHPGRGRGHAGAHVREGGQQHAGGAGARRARSSRWRHTVTTRSASTPSTCSTCRRTSEAISAIPATVPLQLLAYHIAALRGCNVDQPRNLAKSVTVE